MDKAWGEFLKKDYQRGFPAYCGFAVDKVEEGRFETSLQIRPEHRQQDGLVHAGVIATMADHTAGYAAFTTISPKYRILTIEFKINFLRPAQGGHIHCRSQVLSRGKKVIVSESEVFSRSFAKERLLAKAMVTLMVTPAADLVKKDTPPK
jgi:uncharacterized protein (TIGR00369 family)